MKRNSVVLCVVALALLATAFAPATNAGMFSALVNQDTLVYDFNQRVFVTVYAGQPVEGWNLGDGVCRIRWLDRLMYFRYAREAVILCGRLTME